MRTLLTRVGYVSLVLGALMLPPLSEYLPVDLYSLIAPMGHSREGHAYLRVVPSAEGIDPLIWFGLACVVAGVACLVLARRVGPKR